MTKCTFEGCSAKVQRKDVGAHEADCVWRGGQCERCMFEFTPGEPRVGAHPSHPGPFPVEQLAESRMPAFGKISI